MKLESDGILISMRPLNERDSVGRIFTREYGVLCGVLRGALVARQNKPLVGQIGQCAWNARLDTQLGMFHWEPTRNLAAPLMMNATHLNLMNAAFDLIATLLPEREAYTALYQDTLKMLTTLPSNLNAQAAYQDWEICLLRELGYALNLTMCSNCSTQKNLTHLSPRTGRAICQKCAAPYISKLYTLPVTLDTTLRFLTHICDTVGAPIPPSRNRIYPHA